MNLDDLRIFLPKYLSPENEHELFQDIKQFPHFSDQRYYSNSFIDPETVFQGDVINQLPFFDLQKSAIKQKPGLVISNTCDIDPCNTREFTPMNVLYIPIMPIERYSEMLLSEKVNLEKINSHIASLKSQSITNLFYLPPCCGTVSLPESVGFLDRVMGADSRQLYKAMTTNRVSSFSTTGHFLFLYKLSIHFTRFGERVDRGYSSS